MLRLIAVHGIITALAVGAAFAMPEAARYVLFQWWPRAEVDAKLLLASEMILAAVLVLLFHAIRMAWAGRCMLRIGHAAALIEVREHGKRFTLNAPLDANAKPPAARDALVLAVTGFDTFVAAGSHLGRIIGGCYEIRVLLLNPNSTGAARRAEALGDSQAALQAHRNELAASVRYLKQLSAKGKRVRLRLYESPPFWKIVIVGEHAWVQYCHDGYEVKTQPEYVFALRRDRPEQGFFPPFFMHFLNVWKDPRNAEYDLDTDELVVRDDAGNEVRRVACELAEGAADLPVQSCPSDPSTLPMVDRAHVHGTRHDWN